MNNTQTQDPIAGIGAALAQYRAAKAGGTDPTPVATPQPDPSQNSAPAPQQGLDLSQSGNQQPDISGIGDALAQYRTAKANGTAPNVSNPVNPNPAAPSNPGFFDNLVNGHPLDALGSVAKTIAEPAANLVARPIEAAAVGGARLFGGPEAQDSTVNALDSFAKNQLGGVVSPIPQSAADVEKDIGRGVQTVALAIPGIATGGALFGAGNSLEQGNDLFSTQTALQTALGAAGGKVLDLVGKPLMNAAGKVIGTITPPMIKNIAAQGSKAITDFAAAHNIFPEAASTAINNTAQKTTQPLFGSTAEKPTSQLENDIINRFNKGIKPSMSGMNTSAQVGNYEDNIVNAVKTINENKPNLAFTNDAGEVTSGRNPESIQELSDAVDQTKKAIFNKYDSMAKEAGSSGVTVDTKPVVSSLDDVINNKALQVSNPQAVDYAKEVQSRYKNLGSLDAGTTQEIISNYNQALKAFYKNPSYDTASKAGVDALVANNLRTSLDDGISKFSGPGYQDLKKQYGSLAAIEKDVVKASTKNAKGAPKGLLNLTNVVSGGELAHGLISMDPGMIASGLTQKGISALHEYLTNPNRMVRKMFETAEKIPARPLFNGIQKEAPGPTLALPAPRLFATPEGKISPIKQEAADVAATETGAAKAPQAGPSQRAKLAQALQTNEPYVAPKDLPTIKAGNTPKPSIRTQKLNDIYGKLPNANTAPKVFTNDAQPVSIPTPKKSLYEPYVAPKDLPSIQMGTARKGEKPNEMYNGLPVIKGNTNLATLAGGSALGGAVAAGAKLKDMYKQPTQTDSAPLKKASTDTVPTVVSTQKMPGGRVVHTLNTGTQVVDIHPEIKKAIDQAYKNNPGIPKGVLESLVMKESSGGYDNSQKNPHIGKYAWVGGIAAQNGAKTELAKHGIHPNLNTPTGAVDAMAKYWKLISDRPSNQGKNPVQIYDKGGYSSGKLSGDDMKKFGDFLKYYSS